MSGLAVHALPRRQGFSELQHAEQIGLRRPPSFSPPPDALRARGGENARWRTLFAARAVYLWQADADEGEFPAATDLKQNKPVAGLALRIELRRNLVR